MSDKVTPSYWLPVEHSMLRRNQHNNYHTGRKAYMVTLRIEGMCPLLGEVVPTASSCDATPRIAECRLTPLGEVMRQAWLTLPQRFHNISIIDSPEEYVIMPEHFHGIIYATGYMEEHLGEVVRLFKARVAMSYRQQLIDGTATPVGTAKEWQQAYRALSPAQQATTRQWVAEQLALLYSATRCGTQANSGQGNSGAAVPPIKVVSSGKHSKVGFLFGIGYADSLLLDEDNLDGHRRYIYENTKSRWMRTHNRALLKANRDGINTDVSITALETYLRRECPARDVTDSKLAIVRGLLLYSATCCGTRSSATCCGTRQAAGMIVCHSYGDRALLKRRVLPVVCHRKDAALLEQQKARCMQEAASGAVMVSACISTKEREIIEAVMAAGYPVIRVEDNGFPELYHPSQRRIDLCAESKLLIVTPWQYHYRHKDETVFVAYCKTMNCIAQALCRTKDSWWRDNLPRY